MKKITIVGAGRVVEATAQLIAQEDLCKELMLMDIREGVPQGVALDIQETSPLLGFDTKVNGCYQANGITDSIIELPLNKAEQKMFDESSSAFVRILIALHRVNNNT